MSFFVKHRVYTAFQKKTAQGLRHHIFATVRHEILAVFNEVFRKKLLI